MLLDKVQIIEFLKKIKFLNYYFVLDETGDHIEVVFQAYDNIERYRKQKIYVTSLIKIPEKLTPETLVELCFNEVVNSLKHEAGELFTVDGLTPYNEHRDYTEHQRREMINDLFTWT